MDEKLPVVHLGKIDNPQIVFGIDPTFDSAIAMADVKDRTVTVLFSDMDVNEKSTIDALLGDFLAEYEPPMLWPPGGESGSHPGHKRRKPNCDEDGI